MSYRAITMDPPWNEPGGNGKGSDDHYETLDRAGLVSTIVRAACWQPAADCHLYVWTTMNSLLEATWLMGALGFTYKTHVVWVKVNENAKRGIETGIGQYFRGAHELCLFGTRGRGFAARTDHKDIPSVLLAPVERNGSERVHSRKPQEFFDLVERRSHGPWLEMFARSRHSGWDAWGAELASTACDEPVNVASLVLDSTREIREAALEDDEAPPWA